MTSARTAIDIWRAFWGEADDGGGMDDATPASSDELDALLAAASRLAPDSLRLLMAAIRAAATPGPLADPES